MGYGYRNMSADELKGFTMEITFDGKGCNLTLFSGDAWHYAQYKITYQELTEWNSSGKYADDLAWTRSEFVRQFLEDPARADSMPHSGTREWMNPEDEGRYKPNPLCIFLSKWQV